MLTAPKHSRWVADLMDQQNLTVDELARSAGVDQQQRAHRIGREDRGSRRARDKGTW